MIIHVPYDTPLLTLLALCVYQAKSLVYFTEYVRRRIALYVALLWCYTFGWLGVRS